ncbi:hypothetical protein EC957_003037 [Mortierella hygrophila]|uniref:Stress-response A/B barrel domain-containing protein n=1 Tax=Mortierella hygrophila TaxID=979708 RepID=A0A9P6F2M7_9FUNG|nr:hypothetical protein EC957_003037 [Mortierella hygrophila]
MPILHTVLFKIKEDSSDDKVKEMMTAIAAFQNQLPELILSMHSGVDKSAQTQGFSYSFTMIFKNKQDLDTYIASEAHTQFAQKIGHPLIKDAIVVDYEIPGSKF